MATLFEGRDHELLQDVKLEILDAEMSKEKLEIFDRQFTSNQ